MYLLYKKEIFMYVGCGIIFNSNIYIFIFMYLLSITKYSIIRLFFTNFEKNKNINIFAHTTYNFQL